MSLKIIFLGDVVGEAGRKAVAAHLPRLKSQLAADVAIVNAENAAHGFGLTPKVAEQLFASGADILSLGNHAFDQKTGWDYIRTHSRIVRPLNYPDTVGGQGLVAYPLPSGRPPLVLVNPMGRLFMPLHPMSDPFEATEKALMPYTLGTTASAIVVDMHAETTSEKICMAYFLDGRVTLVVGTHTHVPTADGRILPGGTAFQTDAGMCGDYYSSCGMQLAGALSRFRTPLPGGKMEPATGEGTLCGLLLTVGNDGRAQSIEPIQVGGSLPTRLPQGASL